MKMKGGRFDCVGLMGKLFGHKKEEITRIIYPSGYYFEIDNFGYDFLLSTLFNHAYESLSQLKFEYFNKCKRCGIQIEKN